MDDLRTRFRCMQRRAEKSGKYVPTTAELGALFDQIEDMKCPSCLQTMTLFGPSKSRGNRISLQHDHSGRIRLVCLSCNVGHGQSGAGDAYFDIPSGKKYCPNCRKIKDRTDFQKSQQHGHRVYCVVCQTLLSSEHYANNRSAGHEWYLGYYARNKERIKARVNAYRLANLETIRERKQAAYRARKAKIQA